MPRTVQEQTSKAPQVSQKRAAAPAAVVLSSMPAVALQPWIETLQKKRLKEMVGREVEQLELAYL